MRGILIDPMTREITEIDLKNLNRNLQPLKDMIGAECLEMTLIDSEMVVLNGSGVTGRGFHFFGCGDWNICGRAVVIDYVHGKFRGLRENKASFDMIVEWTESEKAC